MTRALVAGVFLMLFACFSIYLSAAVTNVAAGIAVLGAIFVAAPVLSSIEITGTSLSVKMKDIVPDLGGGASSTSKNTEPFVFPNFTEKLGALPIFLLVGCVSGVATYFSFGISGEDVPYSLSPILVYSCALLLLLISIRREVSVLYIAVPIAVWIGWMGSNAIVDSGQDNDALVYLAGAAGALATIAGVSVAEVSLRNVSAYLAVPIVGAIAVYPATLLGATLGDMKLSGISVEPAFLSLFVVWQGMVTACIGFFFRREG
ncbi:hypothetical protein [Rhizobium ruizarguesonis]|uniref:hypothetical protein n=1 Tax=Rhizobium ruizarguesonis TaxID=2081791 RepID=UPI0010326B3F|nr:hypothetical protein [Rhizobium ruizarguesonis]TAT69982.1 hypothetical protein ELI52_38575 [Rhizobium ruizarguesonis]